MEQAYVPQCKICTSKNRDFYESEYSKSNGNLTWSQLEEMAKNLGEFISYRAFERHFSKHFSLEVSKFLQKEETIEQAVDQKKTEAINVVEEIKGNLNGIKSLLDKAQGIEDINASTLGALAAIYREHRQTLEACETLSEKLKSKVGLTRAELIKEIIRSAKDLCPDCREKFMVELDKRLRERGIE